MLIIQPVVCTQRELKADMGSRQIKKIAKMIFFFLTWRPQEAAATHTVYMLQFTHIYGDEILDLPLHKQAMAF